MQDKVILSGWRKRVHEIIFEADTPVGKLFDVTLIIVIALSTLVVMAESVAANCFSLPIYPELSDAHIDRITDTIREAVNS